VQATGNGSAGYFAEEDIYWTPASTMPVLYAQLAQHKYREIPQDQVRYRTETLIDAIFLFTVSCSISAGSEQEWRESGVGAVWCGVQGHMAV